MLVLDASAAVELLLDTEQGLRVAERIADPDETLHAPELLFVEVVSVLRRMLQRDDIDIRVARRALDELEELSVSLYSHRPFVHQLLDLRGNLTAYDAAYVALALALDAPLLTLDHRLAAAAHGAQVEPISDPPT